MYAKTAAVEEGVLAVVSLCFAPATVLSQAKTSTDEVVGYNIVVRAVVLGHQHRKTTLVKTAELFARRLQKPKGNNGYNALTDTYEI